MLTKTFCMTNIVNVYYCGAYLRNFYNIINMVSC